MWLVKIQIRFMKFIFRDYAQNKSIYPDAKFINDLASSHTYIPCSSKSN
jgi:hypothetical protein